MPEPSRDEADHEERLDLSAPATPAMLDLVHSVLEKLWEQHDDVDLADRIRFETAVIEVLDNIVEHAYELDAAPADVLRRFDVSLSATPDELVARFGDNGIPMAIDLSEVTMPGDDAESGRGLALAIAALDDLGYQRVDGRNLWRLTCRRRG
jgi:serine/threonine-protein kinase RsbW